MSPGIGRLKLLKVQDVMSRKVIEVSVNQTMGEAATALAESDVVSAPVIDEQGRCVGMLSAADYVKRDCPQRSEMSQHELTKRGPEDCFKIETTTDMVSCYMSTAVQSVAADESLLRAARAMCAEHIHHLPVLEDGRPIGVVSTMDIVAALINAVDEADAQVKPRDL
ncbi:MAG: CBS domain-containing protein [Pirellulaceae bacterium]|jgi:CBS-domain-containing membrane protein|nr:CBS domain-containing protein [Pirellulaceae bacterium]MDP6722352.1 CBS domain-containing protein [Pirellulaceae bacterium]